MYGQIRELDHKEGWAPNNWCFRIVVLEKTLENPLDCREITPVNPKGNQPWILIGRANAEAKAPILWHLMWRAHSLEKTLMLGKTEGMRRDEDNSGQDGWMASPTQWTWANSGRWWRTGKPGMLPFMGLKRVGHDWLNNNSFSKCMCELRSHYFKRPNMTQRHPLYHPFKTHFLQF